MTWDLYSSSGTHPNVLLKVYGGNWPTLKEADMPKIPWQSIKDGIKRLRNKNVSE